MADASVQIVDAIGRPCPIPVIEAARALRRAAPGALVLVRADDPAAEADLAAFCRATGHRWQSVEREGRTISVLLQACTAD